MFKLVSILFFLNLPFSTDAIIYTDKGCACALAKSSTTTPSAGGSINVGCSSKTDWTGATTEWCLTDEANGQCGTLQTGFGYVDSCAGAGFPEVHIQPAPLIEWNQAPFTYYSGQSINVTWRSQNVGVEEWLRITYQGAGGTRTLTTGSGVNVTAGSYRVRMSDSNNAVTTNVPVTVAAASWSSVSNTSVELLTVVQSKVQDVFVYDGNRSLVSGQTALCDNRNVTVVWRGLGQAQFGTATVSIRSGFGTTVGTALSGIPASGNVSVNYILPRSFTPNGGSSYSAQISVQEPGQNAYTGSSSSFSLAAAPSVTPTPSNTPTPSKTPTPSPTATPSSTPSPSVTSSVSATPTPTPSPTASQTPTNSPTPSTTPSAAPSIDLAALSRAAAEAVDVEGPVLGAVLGTIGGVVLILGTYRFYIHKKQTELRRKKLQMTSRFVEQRNAIYGIQDTDDAAEKSAPSVVMYTLNVGGTNPLTSKRAFPPVASQQAKNKTQV